jgi:hypothetical protein
MPEEFVVGFYGDFGNYLEAFGAFIGNDTFEYKKEIYDEEEVTYVNEPPKEEEKEEEVEVE